MIPLEFKLILFILTMANAYMLGCIYELLYGLHKVKL